MQRTPYFTKAQAVADFKENILPGLNQSDRPLVRMSWNDYVDSLSKAGSIRPGSDWVQPAFVSRSK